MIKNLKIVIRNFLLILICLFHSCMPYQYMPSNQYVPLNKKKGELKASLGISSGPFLQSSNYHEKKFAHIYKLINNIQLGYSFNEHISVFATGHNRDKWTQSSLFTSENDKTIWGNSRLQELILGGSYFKFNNNHSFEILNGIGYGKAFYDYEDNIVVYNYNFSMQANRFSYYIQPDYGFIIGKNFEIGLFSRFLYCKYYKLSSNFRNKEFKQIPAHDYYDGKENVNLYFIEPGFLLRYGSGYLKYQLSVSKTINLNIDRVISEYFTIRFSLLFDFYKR